jgi:tRNA G18 (ribose-2'-O)-methylase SpoU
VREHVETIDDPRLSAYRNISDAQLLTDRQLFIAEGRLLVARLLDSPRFATQSVLVTKVAAIALADVLARREDVPVYEVDQGTMSAVAGFDIHRGCLAVGVRARTDDVPEMTATGRCLVGMEAVGNPDNIGGVFRSAAAFGVDGVLLDERCADPLYRKALRTSMGAALQVRFARLSRWLDTLQECRRSGFRLVALTPHRDAAPLRTVANSLAGERVMLMVGHEGNGLSETAMSLCEVRARIDISPAVDSLNVATAAGIALYEMRRRQDFA